MYKNLKREVAKRAKKDKKLYYEEIVDHQMCSRQQWKGIKEIKSDFAPKVYARCDMHGNPVPLDQRADAAADYLEHKQWTAFPKNRSEQRFEAKIEKWLEDNSDPANMWIDIEYPEDRITLDELIAVIKKMKRRKAPGPDKITTDFLKDLNEDNLILLLELLNNWWSSENFPEGFAHAKTASLYKKGNPNDLENYRPISLLNSFYKCIAAVLQRRIPNLVDHTIQKTQFGFRKAKSTAQALYLIRRIQEVLERGQTGGYIILLDWEKAFDKVSQKLLLKALRQRGVPKKYVDLIGKLYEDPQFVVSIEGKKSSSRKQKSGIRQGCPLSPYLFVVLMDTIFKLIHADVEEKDMDEKLPLLETDFLDILYADDTLL